MSLTMAESEAAFWLEHSSPTSQVSLILTGVPHRQAVRLILIFSMPDARNSHLPNVGLGSKPEVSDGNENVRSWG